MKDALFLFGENVGISVNNADLKAEGSEVNETKIIMGDPVVIHNIMNGGKVFSVETYNSKGCVRARDIGRCSGEIIDLYCHSSSFAVAVRYFCHDGVWIRMGTRFPLKCIGEMYAECLFPYSIFGMFFVRKKYLPKAAMHRGYMEYSRDNMRMLAESALGITYGWGDEGDGIDCSSFICGIFRCMGIFLPRNVKDMLELSCTQCCVVGMEKEKIAEKLEAFGPGCLLLTRGHVMMYYGAPDGEPLFIHCSSRMGGFCMKTGMGPYAQEAVKIILVEK